MNQLIAIENVIIRQNKQGLYCLNDLHRASGQLNKNRPSLWLENKQAQELIQEITKEFVKAGIPALGVVHGGTERGTYACKELVYAYAMWISPAFNLKVIRTFDSVVVRKSSEVDKVNIGLMILESASRTLNLSNSAKLKGYQELQKYSGVPCLLPNYAVDAPSDSVDGSSRVSFSLTHLLQKYEVPLKTTVAYAILKDLGIVERNKRKSVKTGEDKEFWSITAYGLLYGKNLTPPNNPRETQPHFYDSRFKELLKLMQNAKVS
jgi:hypothetical protein